MRSVALPPAAIAAAALSVLAARGIAAEPGTTPAGIGKKDIDVLLLVYDPVLKTQGNLSSTSTCTGATPSS